MDFMLINTNGIVIMCMFLTIKHTHCIITNLVYTVDEFMVQRSI